MANKESVLRGMAAKLEKLDARLAQLHSGLESKGEQVRGRYGEELAKLKAERESLQRQMSNIKEAGAEAWKDMRSGLEKGYKELNKAMDGAWKHFRKEKNVEPPAAGGGA
jgi:chromosome segregation ATPase